MKSESVDWLEPDIDPEQIPEDYDNNVERPMSEIDRREARRALFSAMNDLLDREKIIIVLYYGLDGRGERTLREIAGLYNITPSRAGYILRQARTRLRHPIRLGKIAIEDHLQYSPIPYFQHTDIEKHTVKISESNLNELRAGRMQMVDAFLADGTKIHTYTFVADGESAQ